jgi:hypothetical protein
MSGNPVFRERNNSSRFDCRAAGIIVYICPRKPVLRMGFRQYLQIMTDGMKKICFWGFVILFGLQGLASCMDGKDDSTGYVVGVLFRNEINGLYMLHITDTSFTVYCPEFEDKVARHEMEAGGCYYVVYSGDNTLPENAAHKVRENGYITASLIDCDAAAKYNLNESLVDTSVVLTDEIPVRDAKPSDRVFGYAGGYLFMTHKTVLPEGYTVDWSLSYDEETMMPTRVDNRNYYDLFLRATMAGNGSQTDTAVEHFSFNAYSLKDCLTEVALKEKESLTLDAAYGASSTFTVRINYASEINGDTITWKSTEFSAEITYFLPD